MTCDVDALPERARPRMAALFDNTTIVNYYLNK